MNDYIVQVSTSDKNDGFCRDHFSALNDEVRAFIKDSAAGFRRVKPRAKCHAIIMRNGDLLSNARRFEC